MKSKIFMYLFLFAALWIIFQYANEKKIFESQEQKIEKLSDKLKKAEDSLAKTSGNNGDEAYFQLKGNENAYSYFDAFGVDVDGLEQRIETALISKNTVDGNPLIPYTSDTGTYKINKVFVLNHKWAIADFSDGTIWGELLLTYDVDKAGAITFENVRAIIYPNAK